MVPFRSVAAVDVVEANDVVLAQIVARLDLDPLAMFTASRDAGCPATRNSVLPTTQALKIDLPTVCFFTDSLEPVSMV